MGALRRLLATSPHQTKSATVVSLDFRSIVSKVWINSLWAARAKVLGFLIASALSASPALSAQKAVNPIPQAPEYYTLPGCADPIVADQIHAEYSARHGASDVTAFELHGREAPIRKFWPVDMPRRFCEGAISPPSRVDRLSFHPNYYPIYYAIIWNGPGYAVEWCVVGLDRAWPMDQRCRLARP